MLKLIYLEGLLCSGSFILFTFLQRFVN